MVATSGTAYTLEKHLLLTGTKIMVKENQSPSSQLRGAPAAAELGYFSYPEFSSSVVS